MQQKIHCLVKKSTSIKLLLVMSCFSFLLSSCTTDTGGNQPVLIEPIKPQPGAPSIITLDAREISITSARLSSELTLLGDASSNSVCFEFSTTSGYYVLQTPVQEVNSTGNYSAELKGLLAYQTYYYRAKATGQGTAYGLEKSFTTLPEMVIDINKTYTATIKTSYGDIVIELLPKEAPIAVNNFIRLSRDGFYKNGSFHRVVKDYIIQGGDPTGTGSGNPGYRFADEKVIREYVSGTIAMANAGPNTNGCQFFITLDDLRTRLPKDYTIFGLVTEGLDVALTIGRVPVIAGPGGEVSKPIEAVIIEDILIEEN